MKSTPINYMEAVASLEPLEDRKMRKTLTQYTKFQHLTSHPMHKLIASKPKKRLKRTNFTAYALQIHKRLDLPDLKPDAPLQTSIDWPPWSQQSHPEIAKDIDGISTKRSMSKSLLRCVTQDMLKEKYPSDHWIRAFTDGSASEAIRDGGDGSNCPCGASRQDAQHILQDCPQLEEARRKYWLEPREMNQKLYGSALHLGITAEFINSLDLTI
ncbi:hypothetical protein RRG08_002017 [Elysia crispata]|uniref:Reverse transcriptase n=1 Tax=Elysia crispata TaxID=231223 RepID=A0AAE1AER8_9GAST|nr:hypothetical protein RRG08_002017 [Elysia crispata]